MLDMQMLLTELNRSYRARSTKVDATWEVVLDWGRVPNVCHSVLLVDNDGAVGILLPVLTIEQKGKRKW